VLQNGVCITPVISPENISANPVDFESLLRTIFNDGPNMATISWNPPAGAVVTDVALMFNWACQAGQFQKTIHAIPVPGSKSALVDFTGAGNNGTAIPCPENGVPMSRVAPVSAGIRLTYKANGVGPDLYVVKPYGQAPCRAFIPTMVQFPMIFEITETWKNAGNSIKFNHTVGNPFHYAGWLGMASQKVFKACNGQFVPASGSKIDLPTATDPQNYSNIAEASNGLITFTNRVTRPGSKIAEDTSFVFQYRIATGDYTFTVTGGQRDLEYGNTSTVAGNRSGKVPVSVGGAIP
jgi:hypothetical protein